jgi:hypothetical protein
LHLVDYEGSKKGSTKLIKNTEITIKIGNINPMNFIIKIIRSNNPIILTTKITKNKMTKNLFVIGVEKHAHYTKVIAKLRR